MAYPDIGWSRLKPRSFGLKTRVFAAVFFVLGAAALGVWAFAGERPAAAEGGLVFGATFSKEYAQSLGLDWQAAYTAVLDDLGIRLLRIPAYWDEIEPQPGHFDFSDVDWQISEAARRGAKVVLAVGLKLPRWPECHAPGWTEGMGVDEIRRRQLVMVEAAVKHFRGEPAIVNWQIENEPLFQFGEDCPRLTADYLKDEVAAVKELDSRPIILQDAGEFSTWGPTARYADTLGVSLYRVVWDKRFGYVRWPGLAAAYQLRAALARRHVDKVIITELQAEPWVTESITKVPIRDQLAQMNPDQLKNNVRFAERIGFPQAYFWGVEWWYWIKQQGHPEMWEAAKKMIGGPVRVASAK